MLSWSYTALVLRRILCALVRDTIPYPLARRKRVRHEVKGEHEPFMLTGNHSEEDYHEDESSDQNPKAGPRLRS